MEFLKNQVLDFPAVASFSKELSKYIDACTCGRENKVAVLAIKQELERKDAAIERLQEEIRRKDGEKDSLIRMQRDLQDQILQIRRAIGTDMPAGASGSLLPPPSTEELQREKAVVSMQAGIRGRHGRKRVAKQHAAATRLQARKRGERDRNFVAAVAEIRELELTHIGISSQGAHPYWEARVPRAALPGFLVRHKITLSLSGRRAALEAPAHPNEGDHVLEFLYAKDQRGKVVAAARCTPGKASTLAFNVSPGVATLTGFLACNQHGVWQSEPVEVPYAAADALPPPQQQPQSVRTPSRAASRTASRTAAQPAALTLAQLDGSAAEQLAARAPPPEDGGYDHEYDEESIDSDYNFEAENFESLGGVVLSGPLKLAKVYGQEAPPAAEDELEWEVRHFVLHDNKKLVHYDGVLDGVPSGDRGLVLLDGVKAIEKVLGVDTFVMRGDNKVHMFKLQPHDEAAMLRWIAAISQQVVPR